jgi:hypothetical protein
MLANYLWRAASYTKTYNGKMLYPTAVTTAWRLLGLKVRETVKNTEGALNILDKQWRIAEMDDSPAES